MKREGAEAFEEAEGKSTIYTNKPPLKLSIETFTIICESAE